MPEAGHNVLVAAAIISISLNPLLFRALPTVEGWLRRRRRLWRLLNMRAEGRAASTNAASPGTVGGAAAGTDGRFAIVVGYGPVGRSVHRLLQEAGVSTAVIDLNFDTIGVLRAEGQAAIFGDASHESLLEHAGVRRASHLIVTLPDSSDRTAVIAAARSMNATVRILVRARYLRERQTLEQAGATATIFEEAEAAVALAQLMFADMGLYREAPGEKIEDLRLHLRMESLGTAHASVGERSAR